MTQYFIKVFVSAALIVLAAEISKRSTLMGGLLASLPLVSLLVMVWLYVDTRDAQKVAQLSTSIFWLVLPSLALFLILPVLLKSKMNFYLSLGLSTAAMLVCYGAMVGALKFFGVKL